MGSLSMTERDDMLDMKHQLELKLWAGEYYEQGQPIVRLLGELGIAIFRSATSKE